MAKNKKPYREWSAEEKASYEAKRKAYLDKRQDERVKAYATLGEELKKLGASKEAMRLYELVKPKGTGQASAQQSSVLVHLFGTDEPKKGQKASFLFVGVRGPKGERMLEKETLPQFIARVGDATFKYDASSIAELVWRAKQKGHTINIDKDKALVEYVG